MSEEEALQWETHLLWAEQKQAQGQDIGIPRSCTACPVVRAMGELTGYTWETCGDSLYHTGFLKKVKMPQWMQQIIPAVDRQTGVISAGKYLFLLRELHRFSHK